MLGPIVEHYSNWWRATVVISLIYRLIDRLERAER